MTGSNKSARGCNQGLVRATQVLIVDDHELLRDGMRLMIEHEPDLAVCGEAADEPEAMKQVRRCRPDLVIVDISLKSGNGIELIKRIKSYDPSILIIVSSMYDEKIYGERALRAGALGYVSKQNPADSLMDAIRSVIDGKNYFSEEMTQRLLRLATGKKGAVQTTFIATLSDRELEVFQLIGQGLSGRGIAERLHLSPRTVDTYRERLKSKLNVDSSTELHHRAVQWALEQT